MKDAIEAVRAAANLVSEVLPVTREDVLSACDLLKAHQHLSARDSLHAAVMRNSSINLVASMDADFDVLKDVKRLSPSDAATLSR